MRWIVWIIRILLFVFVLALALKNTVSVPITFFWDIQGHAPLVLLLLIFLITGVVLGMLAMLGRIWALNRQVTHLKQELHSVIPVEDKDASRGEIVD